MTPNKIMSVACVPPSCVNKPSAEMGAVLLDVIIKETDPRSQDVWVPSDNFLETTQVLPLHCTDGETEAEGWHGGCKIRYSSTLF